MSKSPAKPAAINPPGPYAVERVDSDAGPRWRLVGPGLDATRAYAWPEVREKLDELAAVMNFAWQQGRAAASSPHDAGH